MIVYSATKEKFQNDIMTNDIENIILDAFKTTTGRRTISPEIMSWKNSLPCMGRILQDDAIPKDTGVAIEYHIPQSSKRIDFILTGKDHQNKEAAVLIELKQWQHAYLTDKDAIVSTRFKHGEVETPHPSYQVWSYKCLLEDFNQTVQEEKIGLYPCAYLHNYDPDDVITNKRYSKYIQDDLPPEKRTLRLGGSQGVFKCHRALVAYRRMPAFAVVKQLYVAKQAASCF